MRIFCCMLLAVLLTGVSTGAQAYPNEFFATGLSHVFHVDSKGKVQSAWLPGMVTAATMNWNNRAVLVHDFTRKAILQVDPRSLAVLGTYFTDPSLSQISGVRSMEFDHNGDLYFTSTTPNRGVFRIDDTLSLRTVVSTASTLAPFGNALDVTVDIDSGDLIVSDANASLGYPVYQLRRDGSQFKTLGIGFDFFADYGTQQHILTGDIYAATCCGSTLSTGKSAYLLRAGQSKPVVWLNHPVLRAAWGPFMDRASAPNQRFFSGSWADPNNPGAAGIWVVDIRSGTPTKLATIAVPGFSNIYRVIPVHHRNLQTVRIQGGWWNILLNCPAEGSRAYTMALGLSGVRPAVPLPDGRRIALVPDLLTVLSLNGSLGPILTGHVGTLQSGRATARLDLRALVQVLKGTRVWIAAVVLDPSAPIGISLIPDPKVLLIE